MIMGRGFLRSMEDIEHEMTPLLEFLKIFIKIT